MKILILGASGYAGSCIKKALEARSHEITGTYRTMRPSYSNDASMARYELGDKERLNQLLRDTDPDAVLSCLTGDFDRQENAYETILRFLKEKPRGKFLFLSTSNVFDGALESAHYENDAPKAESEYGQFKIRCENRIRNALGERGIILRIPEIWGTDCPRLQAIQSSIREGSPILTFRNLFVNVTTNRQIAAWIDYIVEKDLNGTFHIGTEDVCEYVRFHRELISALSWGEPAFDIREQPARLVQAVLPGRDEIPPSMRFRVKDVVRFLSGTN